MNVYAPGREAQPASEPALDLFGQPLKPDLSLTQKRGKPKGYAGTPGLGPKGETCKTCGYCFATYTGSGKRFNKCQLVTPTRGPGTDIRRATPACQLWRPIPDTKTTTNLPPAP